MIRHDPTIPLGPTGTVGAHGLGDERGSASDLLEEIRRARPAWMKDALCREPHPGVNFFPERGQDQRPAKAICARCAARDECLAYAMAENITQGIWGRPDRQRAETVPPGELTDAQIGTSRGSSTGGLKKPRGVRS